MPSLSHQLHLIHITSTRSYSIYVFTLCKKSITAQFHARQNNDFIALFNHCCKTRKYPKNACTQNTHTNHQNMHNVLVSWFMKWYRRLTLFCPLNNTTFFVLFMKWHYIFWSNVFTKSLYFCSSNHTVIWSDQFMKGCCTLQNLSMRGNYNWSELFMKGECTPIYS